LAPINGGADTVPDAKKTLSLFYSETVRATEPKLCMHVQGYYDPIEFEIFLAPINAGATTVLNVEKLTAILLGDAEGY